MHSLSRSFVISNSLLVKYSYIWYSQWHWHSRSSLSHARHHKHYPLKREWKWGRKTQRERGPRNTATWCAWLIEATFNLHWLPQAWAEQGGRAARADGGGTSRAGREASDGQQRVGSNQRPELGGKQTGTTLPSSSLSITCFMISQSLANL